MHRKTRLMGTILGMDSSKKQIASPESPVNHGLAEKEKRPPEFDLFVPRPRRVVVISKHIEVPDLVFYLFRGRRSGAERHDDNADRNDDLSYKAYVKEVQF